MYIKTDVLQLTMDCLPLHFKVWDSATGKLKKDLQYQADETYMMHDEAVLCLNFSRDSELLVSGEPQDGQEPLLELAQRSHSLINDGPLHTLFVWM